MPAMSVEQRVVVEENGEVKFRLEGGGCRIFFDGMAKRSAVSSQQDDPNMFTMQEYCEDSVSTEEETMLLEKLFESIFNQKLFANDNLIWFERMSAMPFECELVRYASASPEWPPLLKKLGGKSREFKEGPPDELQFALGEFVRKAGLLRNLEKIFSAYGYSLKRVTVGNFRMIKAQELYQHQRQCLVGKLTASILPSNAEMFLVFEHVK